MTMFKIFLPHIINECESKAVNRDRNANILAMSQDREEEEEKNKIKRIVVICIIERDFCVVVDVVDVAGI